METTSVQESKYAKEDWREDGQADQHSSDPSQNMSQYVILFHCINYNACRGLF